MVMSTGLASPHGHPWTPPSQCLSFLSLHEDPSGAHAESAYENYVTFTGQHPQLRTECVLNERRCGGPCGGPSESWSSAPACAVQPLNLDQELRSVVGKES